MATDRQTLEEPHYTEISWLDLADPELIDTAYKAIRDFLIPYPGSFQKDHLLKYGRFYKIQLHQNIYVSEVFGRLCYCNPEDTIIDKIQTFKFIIPTKTSPAIKATVRGDFVDKAKYKSLEILLPRAHVFLDESDMHFFSSKEQFRQMGFEPIIYDKPNLQQLTGSAHLGEKAWIFIISAAWLHKMGGAEFSNARYYLERLVEQDNHLVINYRTPQNDFDLNRTFGIIPPQWAPHSFYDAYELKDIKMIVEHGLRNKIMTLPLGRLAK